MNLNLLYVLCKFVLIIHLFSIHSECKSSKPNNDFEGSFLNLIYKPLAIDINTKNIQIYSTQKPILLTGTVTAQTFLVNTGQSIETINQIHNVANVTGGGLQDVYIYLHFIYYWADNFDGITGTKIDGKGFPYEVRVVYRNRKYKTISEAVKHRDGLFELVLLFDTCLAPNKEFQKLGYVIKMLQNAGSFRMVNLMEQIDAANFIPINSPYYSYSGSFINVKTGQIYQCSTVKVIKPNPAYSLSHSQFDDTFGLLRNFSGIQFSNTMRPDPANVNVSETFGVNQALLS